MRKAPLAILAWCGLVASGQGVGDPATDHLQCGADPDPHDSLRYFELAEMHLENGNLQTAANEFDKALHGDLQPLWIARESHIKLGWIFETTNQPDRAKREYALAAESPMDLTWSAPRRKTPIAAPMTLDKAKPQYTAEARVAGLEGEVTLSFIIDCDGNVHDISVMQSIGLDLEQKAIDALKQWSFAPATLKAMPVAAAITVIVPFRLPEKQSRWHLLHVKFETPGSATRPHFTKVKYPLGAGISRDAYEEGRIVAAAGRLATVKLAFDVDTDGIPKHFAVREASADMWGPQAVALVREWEFSPGMKNGVAVAVPCVVDLAWGARQLAESGHAASGQ